MICCLFLLSLMGIDSLAQDTVITLRGDTLKGKYEITRRSDNEFVDFQSTSGKKQKLRLFDVKRILTADGDIIEPIQIQNRYTFGKLITSGYLSLYAFKGANSKTVYNEMVLTKLDGSSQVVPGAIGFRKTIGAFLSECSEVSDKIKDRSLTKNDLQKIIADFNACFGQTASPAPEVTTVSDTPQQEVADSSLQTQISDFKTLLKYSDKVSNKEDVSDMFDDIVGKINSNKPVPNYLRKLIISSVESDEQLKKLIQTILK